MRDLTPAEWQGATVPYPTGRTLHSLFEEQAARRAQAVAVQDGDACLTYGELDERANQLAHYLRDRGVESDQPVAVCMDRSLDFVVAALAILKAGGAYVPFSPDLPPRRIQSILEDVSPSLLVTHRNRFAGPLTNEFAVLHVDSDAAAFAPCPTTPPPEVASPTSIACILFTSGSTGRPKGVQFIHRGIVQLLIGPDYVPFGEDQVFMLLASVTFDVSVFELWGALLHGARCVAYSEPELDFRRLGNLIRGARVSCLWLTSTLFNSLIDLDPELLSGVSYLLTGGEALSIPHVRKGLKALPSTRIIDGYGPAECTVFTSLYAIPRDFPPDARSVPIGKPIANTRVYILDPDKKPVPVGTPGELYVGKDNLARGYHRRPELTAECFLPDPFRDDPDARMYKSGDRCRWLPDGNVEFLGRFDSQVKVRGFRIELAEIEWALGQHPRVRQSATCVHGEGNSKRIAAFVVPAEADRVTEDDLRSHVAEYLPAYMVPSSFVFLDALPLTSSGKTDRQTLCQMAAHAAASVASDVAPETETERTLEGIWKDVFDIEHVGVEDDFFDLGGESLKGASVLARISRVRGIDLKHRHLFDMPTIRGLACYLDGLSGVDETGSSLKIGRRVEATSAPLSFEQEEVWSSLQVHADEPLFNEPFTLRIRGTVDPVAMSEALNDLADRHEVFRTAIRVEEGIPVQVISDRAEVPCRVLDLRDHPPEEREAKAVEAAAAETRREFRLDQPPLLRVLLATLDENDSRLYVIMHHTVTDAWTFYDVLIPELRVLYDARLGDVPPSLQPPGAQYADYARWQRARLQGPEVDTRLEVWRERFRGAQALALVPDRLPVSGPSSRGESLYASIPSERVAALRDLARRESATLFMTLLAGFNAILARYTQEDDIVVGTAVDCRSAPELEAAAGCFVRAVPVRADLRGNPTFRELLERVRGVLLETYDIKDVPFSELLDALHTPGGPSRQELLKVTCVLEPGVPELPRGWDGQQVEIQTGTSKFDLLFEFEERDERVTVRIERNTGLYEAATADRMLSHFLCFLQAAAADPDRRIGQIPLVPKEDARSLVAEFAGSSRPYPRNATVHGVFEREAAQRPDAVAVVDGETELSYGELNSRANRFAHYLLSRGVTTGKTVALCMDRSWEYVVAVLGILKAGAVYVPLEPGLPSHRVEYILNDAGASLLLVHRDCCDDVNASGVAVVRLDDVSADIAVQPDRGCETTATAESLAYIMYTSGSTGEPKGVEITHRGINRLVCGNDYVPLDADVTSLLLASIGFDASTFELWAPLLNGGRCVVYARRDVDLELLERTIAEAGVTCLWLTAALFNAVVDIRPRLLSPVSHVLTGGEALSVPHVRRAQEQLPDVRIINGYGPTENTTFSCTYAIPRAVPEHTLSVPIGRPLANSRVYILDPFGQPVPVGVPGELYVGGDGLARGYRNQPELTEERFVADPFAEEAGARMYRTGDRCRWLPDGNIEFLGRFDQQVKLRGFRVEPGEIEVALAQHPAVAQCAVAIRGEGDERRLVGYVTPIAGADCALDGLRPFLANRLPTHMVPACYVALDALPMTTNGKLDRDALPEPDGYQREYVPPRTDTERALVDIWKENLAAEPIGVNDDFFELGGHSLKALSIAAAMERTFGRPIALNHFFTAPTVAQLAAVVDGAACPEASGKAVRLAGTGPLPPLFCIPGAGGTVFSFKRLAAEIGRTRPVYGLQYPGLGEGETPLDSLEAVAEELVRRILEAEPQGPYNIVGYSLGGYVAFEVGCRLHAMGRRVDTLGLIDCMAPNALVQRALPERIRLHMARLWEAGRGARVRYLLGRLRRRVRTDDGRAPLVPQDESGLGVDSLRHVQEHMEKAAEVYSPGVYPGRVILFRAVQPDWVRFTVMDDLMGWRPHAQGGVEVHSITGLHLDIFKEPHVDALTSALARCLDEADSGAV
ncbi:MAG: amino acid adenylation domain-containing protein [bacterium]|nr:amino acid adenylation domain-containing protein [bacterium]